MFIINPNSNGERAGQSHSVEQIGVANRRHAITARRAAAAREAGLLERQLSGSSSKEIKNAAAVLVQQVSLGKISRQQLEEEQRADETRLKGWEVTAPMPGTPGEGKLEAIRYRMAVRARALEEIGSIELGLLTANYGRELPGGKVDSRRKKGLPLQK